VNLEQAVAREAIRYTQSLCAAAGDRGRLEEMLGAYIDDGVLEIPAGVFRGKAAIAAALQHVPQRRGTEAASEQQRFFVRHHLTTCHIEFTGADTANARTYFLMMTPAGVDHCGVYSDRFVASASRWLIAHRRVRVDWAAEQSLVASSPGRWGSAPGPPELR
jgi:hypothetical protein